MSEVSVLIDLPDGWELADKKMRPAKKGEWIRHVESGQAYQVQIDTRNAQVIVRPKQPEYVNVRLRREHVKARAEHCTLHRMFIGNCDIVRFPECATRVDYAEALANKPDAQAKCGKIFSDCTCVNGAPCSHDRPCQRPLGHTEPHADENGYAKPDVKEGCPVMVCFNEIADRTLECVGLHHSTRHRCKLDAGHAGDHA